MQWMQVAHEWWAKERKMKNMVGESRGNLHLFLKFSISYYQVLLF